MRVLITNGSIAVAFRVSYKYSKYSSPFPSTSPFHLLHRHIKGSATSLGAKGMLLTVDAIIKIMLPMRDDPLAPKGATLPLMRRERRWTGEAEGKEGGGERSERRGMNGGWRRWSESGESPRKTHDDSLNKNNLYYIVLSTSTITSIKYIILYLLFIPYC